MTPKTGLRRCSRWRRTAMQAVCAAYIVFLTVLLLSRDPNRYVPVYDGWRAVLQMAMPYAHFLSFVALSFLVLSVGWKAPWWALLLLMAVYGAGTEWVQGFVGRTPDIWDWLQDVVGVAIGAAAWLMAAAWVRRWRRAAIEKRRARAA